jgi:integrase
VAQVPNLYRRVSGIYAVRLVVPIRLREAIGKGEVHVSTGSRMHAVAKAVACGVLAHWRQKFLNLDGIQMSEFDIERVWAGSARLATGQRIRLLEAARESGLGIATLLQTAQEGRLSLFVTVPGLWGHGVRLDALQGDLDGSGGNPVDLEYLPLEAEHQCFAGTLRIRNPDSVAAALQTDGRCMVRALNHFSSDAQVFITESAFELTAENLEVSTAEVDALRMIARLSVTSGQRQAAKSVMSRKVDGKSTARASTYIDRYSKSLQFKEEQIKLIRKLLELFCELEGDPRFCDIDNELLHHFRDVRLIEVPDREEKIRLIHKTKSVSESIAALTGTDYKRLTAGSIAKRIQWLAGFLKWIDEQSKLTTSGIASAGAAAPAKKTKRDDESRPKFEDEDLSLIFSSAIFLEGKGKTTKSETYRTFMPWHYFGPLIALHTGMRPNECCQMEVSDICEINDIWCFDIKEDDETEKSLKTVNSKRLIPIHPFLIKSGLIEWRDRVKEAGYLRLWPEWIQHATNKRYSPGASKWFNGTFINSVPMKEPSDKTLYSFRHNFISALNNLDNPYIPESVINQISGHKRGKTESANRYNKGRDVAKLHEIISRLDFNLPDIARFDMNEGKKALQDAMDRKEGRKPRN